MATTERGERPVGVAFIGTGAVTAYHHLPGLRLDSRAELVAICDADPDVLARRKDGMGRRVGHRPTRGAVLPATRRRCRRDRHAQRHAPADRGRGGPGGQARHVREAARALGRARSARCTRPPATRASST